AQVHTQAYVSSCAISTAAIHATSNIHARPRWIAQIRCRRRFLMRYEMRRIVAARNVARAMPGVSAAALARCKCVRTALCLIAVPAGAAASAEREKNAQRDTPRASSNALAASTHGRALEPIELPVLGEVSGTPIGGKGLVAVPSSAAAAPALGFVEHSCA